MRLIRGAWPAAAAMSAAALVALLVLAGPGSLQIVWRTPAGTQAAQRLPAWTGPCWRDAPMQADPNTLAFCARVDGRVIATDVKPDGLESHVLVTSRFHVTLVELPVGEHPPAWGARIIAVGPLQRAHHGLREMIALPGARG